MRRLAFAVVGLLFCQIAAVSTAQNTAPPSISASDYLELERTTCFGSCPAYTVRIQADGQVTWKGVNYVKVVGNASARVPAVQARTLIEKAVANGFWDLNAGYSANVTDAPTYFTTLHIGTREKRVGDYASMAPKPLQDLETEIDSLANTYRWVHGEPDVEVFALVPRRDVPQLASTAPLVPAVSRPRAALSGSKAGLTPLMRASAMGELAEVNRLLAQKENPNAQDSSGWTALIYAMDSPATGDAVIPALLAAGADPKLKSSMGQTATMAAATSFSSPLQRLRFMLDAGGDINTQDKNGQTALMFAANALMSVGDDTSTRFKDVAELITFMRTSGARNDLRDANGFSVLDYVLQNAHSRAGTRIQYQKTRAILEDVLPGVHPPAAIHGRVLQPPETLAGYAVSTVVLERAGNGVNALRAPVAADGTFTFSSVAAGLYSASLLPSASIALPQTLITVANGDVNGVEISALPVREVIIHPTIQAGGALPSFGLIVANALPGPKIGIAPRIPSDTSRPLPPNISSFIGDNAGAMSIQVIRIVGNTQDDTQLRIFLPSPWSGQPVFVAEPLPDGNFRITLPEGNYSMGVAVAPTRGIGVARTAYSASITRNGTDIQASGLKIQGNDPVKIEIAFKTN
jgi:hypothetical protein